jgi:hypothetical protein
MNFAFWFITFLFFVGMIVTIFLFFIEQRHPPQRLKVTKKELTDWEEKRKDE